MARQNWKPAPSVPRALFSYLPPSLVLSSERGTREEVWPCDKSTCPRWHRREGGGMGADAGKFVELRERSFSWLGGRLVLPLDLSNWGPCPGPRISKGPALPPWDKGVCPPRVTVSLLEHAVVPGATTGSAWASSRDPTSPLVWGTAERPLLAGNIDRGWTWGPSCPTSYGQQTGARSSWLCRLARSGKKTDGVGWAGQKFSFVKFSLRPYKS